MVPHATHPSGPCIKGPMRALAQVARVNAPWVRSDLTSGNRLLLIGTLEMTEKTMGFFAGNPG
jgi:hypothetical protein